jgi:hypothetical protein
MTTSPGNVTVAGSLVRYLRSGVKEEMAGAIEILQAELDTNLTPATFRTALRRFDDSRTVLEMIGFVDEPNPVDVQLDLSRWPQLVLKALGSEHSKKVQRVQDAAAAGIKMPRRDISGLESLLAEVRTRLGTVAEDRPPPRLERRAPPDAEA